MTQATRRPKDAFDPALEAPVAVTPDQLERVVGGLARLKLVGIGGTGTTTGAVPPPPPPFAI
jgi:hypothetical protein